MNFRSLFCAALISTASMYMPAPASIAEERSQNIIQDQRQQPIEMDRTPKELILSDSIMTARAVKQPMLIVVDKTRHLTHVLQNHDGEIVEVFSAPNATGAKRTPTPEGRVKVVSKQLDPIWSPPVSIDPKQRKVAGYTSKNKHNPLGVAWLGLSKWSIGLHGTNAPASIGRNASHGCVRHRNADAKALFDLVPVGTPVYIVSNLSGTRVSPEDASHLSGRVEMLVERPATTDDAQLARVHMASLSNL